MIRVTSFALASAFAIAFGSGAVGAQLNTAPPPAVRPAIPVAAADAIIDAFRTHDIVTLSDPHGRAQMQSFLLTLLRDARLPGLVNDIVLEAASARYQDALDRFVRGDPMPEEMVRGAWEDTTQPQTTGVYSAELIGAVRTINAALPRDRQMRVLAGDPPIDWTHVTSREDHFRWIELRDSYPADLIRRQVLERGRRALVVYGQMHTQRKQLASNYNMSVWQSQTLVSLLERDGAKVFSIWTLFEGEGIFASSAFPKAIPAGVKAWSTPSLALARGSDLGATDFATFFPLPNRFDVRNGTFAPAPRAEWRVLPMEEQFDAVLYLGPAGAVSDAALPRALCADTRFLQTRFERIALAGLPQIEVDQLKQRCQAAVR